MRYYTNKPKSYRNINFNRGKLPFKLIVFIGIKAVTEGQQQNELYNQYLYQER